MNQDFIRGLRSIASKFYEGDMVKIADDSNQVDLRGKVGEFVRYNSATVEIDGERKNVALREIRLLDD